MIAFWTAQPFVQCLRCSVFLRENGVSLRPLNSNPRIAPTDSRLSARIVNPRTLVLDLGHIGEIGADHDIQAFSIKQLVEDNLPESWLPDSLRRSG